MVRVFGSVVEGVDGVAVRWYRIGDVFMASFAAAAEAKIERNTFGTGFLGLCCGNMLAFLQGVSLLVSFPVVFKTRSDVSHGTSGGVDCTLALWISPTFKDRNMTTSPYLSSTRRTSRRSARDRAVGCIFI